MKISVVTPSYNQGQFILRTLQSVAAQSGASFEHVVFDGGSTDQTVEILKSFAAPLRWVSKKDGGQADAVNQGIQSTNGEIIAWLNSDDIYYPGAFQKVIEVFQNNPDVDVVYGNADHIDVLDNSFEEYPTESWSLERLFETCFICQPALFFRRSLVERYGVLDASLNYCMDYEYWLRLAVGGAKFLHIPMKLAGSRLYADNKTLGARVKVHREINDMFKMKFGKVPDRWLFNYATVCTESQISRDKFPKLFLGVFALRSLKNAIYWNGFISSSMVKKMLEWIVGMPKKIA